MSVWDNVVSALEPYARASLTDSCTIRRVVKGTREAGGAYPESLEAVASEVPCRVTPATLAAQQTVLAGSADALSRWLLSVWRGTDLRRDDRVTAAGVDADGNAWTRELVVIAPDGPRSYEVLRTATCSEPATSGR